MYYEPWEQEYGLPLRTPTPYGVQGNAHYFGQRVEIAPLHVAVSARGGAVIDSRQVHIVMITWRNPTGQPIPMNYFTRVRVRSIRQPNGAQVTDAWGMTEEALQMSGLSPPAEEILPGESEVHVPIIAPPGTVEIAEVAFLAGASLPAPTGTPAPGSPTPTATSNPDLRAGEEPFLVAQWHSGGPHPPCDDPGVVTDWGDGPPSLPNIPAPPGTARVVQIALNQVGKPYIWGAKGPNAFDCSGLTEWSYAQIGITIPTGTVGQWPGLPPVDVAQAMSGDLIFFDTLGAGRVTHVGLISDLDGDGDWDMVHAASPEYGVRVDHDVFTRAYYGDMYRGLRTVR